MEIQEEILEYFQSKVKIESELEVTEMNDIEDEFVVGAINLIEENIDNSNFGLSSLMSHFHMSQSSLYKKVKSSTGLSPTEFIRSVRLKNAAKIILEKKPEKLRNVAADVGFNDYRYFKRSFKKHFGCLPSEYKRYVIAKLYNRIISNKKMHLKPEQLNHSTSLFIV